MTVKAISFEFNELLTTPVRGTIKMNVAIFFFGFCLALTILSFGDFITSREYNIDLLFYNIGIFLGSTILYTIISIAYRLFKRKIPFSFNWALGLSTLVIFNDALKQKEYVILIGAVICMIIVSGLHFALSKKIKDPVMCFCLTLALAVLSSFALKEQMHTQTNLKKLETAFEKNKLFALVAADFSEEFERVKKESEVQMDVDRGEYFYSKMMLLLNEVFPCYLSKASDELIFDHFKKHVANLEVVYNKDPILFLKFIDPNTFGSPSLENIDDLINTVRLPNSLMDIKIKIVEEKGNRVNSDLEQIEAEKHLKDILTKLYQDFGIDAVNAALYIEEGEPVSNNLSAKIMLAFNKEVLNLGLRKCALVARYLNSNQCSQVNKDLVQSKGGS